MITNIVLHYSEAQQFFFYLDRKLSCYKDMMPKDNPFYYDLFLKIYGLNCCDLLTAFLSPGLKHFTFTTKLRSHKKKKKKTVYNLIQSLRYEKKINIT